MQFELEKFLFDTPIYTAVEINDNELDSDEVDSLFYSSDAQKRTLEGFNTWQKSDSSFKITRTLSYLDEDFKDNGGIASVYLECKRYHDEFQFFILWDPSEKILYKVGQLPTVADFHVGEIKQYKKVLSNDKLKEFTRAVGLAANGVGIGSFVYLRRIFEYLIHEAYQLASSNGDVTEEDFQQSRMDDRIDLLAAYLPSFLVETKGMYSILSLGIHELDEQTCLYHFDTVKVAIEIILDEKLDELRKKEKIEAVKKKLDKAKGEVKNTTANKK